MADSRTVYSVDEVRERTSIGEIVAPHVRLRKAGKRLVGLCPFHPDQAPSFTLDPEKGLWHCFGCGAGGNVFHFLMRAENLTFAEAARKLAERLGAQLKGSRETARAQDARDRKSVV
jgi:DNA primase